MLKNGILMSNWGKVGEIILQNGWYF